MLRTLDDFTHDDLAMLVREYLLGGHLIDRAGMPQVVSHGIDVMRDVAIDEWMGASPIYTKRMQRLLDFEGDTVETVFKGMQFDIGAPPEFLDFRYEIDDERHGSFQLAHCGALMDVEPMGDDFVTAMCHDIEDPTFDATGWATNPRLRMRPEHRPPRVPADRVPHCRWTATIEVDAEPAPEPPQAVRMGTTRAAALPLATYPATGDGDTDYRGPLDADVRFGRFSTATLRAILDEVALQGHLLTLSFSLAASDRLGPDGAADATAKQGVGASGLAAQRLCRALELGGSAADLATLLSIHPAFMPRRYVGWRVELAGDDVICELSPCEALAEAGAESWVTLLAAGNDRLLSAIAAASDPCWEVVFAGRGEQDGVRRWRIERGETPAAELPEVTLAKLSTGSTFRFARPT